MAALPGSWHCLLHSWHKLGPSLGVTPHAPSPNPSTCCSTFQLPLLRTVGTPEQGGALGAAGRNRPGGRSAPVPASGRWGRLPAGCDRLSFSPRCRLPRRTITPPSVPAAALLPIALLATRHASLR
jgi:hypothetical protein